MVFTYAGGATDCATTGSLPGDARMSAVQLGAPPSELRPLTMRTRPDVTSMATRLTHPGRFPCSGTRAA